MAHPGENFQIDKWHFTLNTTTFYEVMLLSKTNVGTPVIVNNHLTSPRQKLEKFGALFYDNIMMDILRNEFGFHAKTGFCEGLQKTIAWYENHC